jgi:hypothetical protein
MDMICHRLKLHSVLYWERATSYILFSLASWVEELKLLLTTIVVTPLPSNLLRNWGKGPPSPSPNLALYGYDRSITDPKKGTMSTCMYGSGVVAFS